MARGGINKALVSNARETLISRGENPSELLSNLVYGLRRRSCLTDPVLVPHP